MQSPIQLWFKPAFIAQILSNCSIKAPLGAACLLNPKSPRKSSVQGGTSSSNSFFGDRGYAIRCAAQLIVTYHYIWLTAHLPGSMSVCPTCLSSAFILYPTLQLSHLLT
jgi:hypothetical protein